VVPEKFGKPTVGTSGQTETVGSVIVGTFKRASKPKRDPRRFISENHADWPARLCARSNAKVVLYAPLKCTISLGTAVIFAQFRCKIESVGQKNRL
jgi:hypothetical protein